MYPSFSRIFAVLSLLFVTSHATRVFTSSSLNPCQTNSSFTASLFDIHFFPDNRTLDINVVGDSTVTGNVTFRIEASAYGYRFLNKSLDPCTLNIPSLCPIDSFQLSFDSTFSNVSTSIIGSIPSIAYQIPDLDALVTVYMYTSEDQKDSVACVQAQISNSQTVDQTGVRWATALIAILGLASAGIVSSLGFANTAAHMLLYALAMFSYFQAVAIIGLCAVPLPPIVLSWTLDMSWSIGVIRVGFLQKFATWYQRSTGGTPSTVLATVATKSVQIAKRAFSSKPALVVRHHLTKTRLYTRAAGIVPRATDTTSGGSYIVTGIQRLAFLQDMESTNLFFTSLTFYCIFVIFSLLAVVLFKYGVEQAVKLHWITPTNPMAVKVRTDWRVTLKGIIFRLLLIGYPPMMILCLWEFTQTDSGGEVFLAVLFFFSMTAALAWAAFKVWSIGRRSKMIYKTSAFSLYADGTVLRKWGLLYTQFKASAYFYVIPVLVYTLVKAFFIGLGQGSGETQAIALILIEAFALVGASVFRPWMDKTTNGINITICVINFLNAVMLLIFTNIFDGPGLLIGVLGVVFFILNVVFALILLVTILVVIAFSFIRKNPDTKYQPVADNRASFIKSQTALTTELDALGASARGDSMYMGEEKRSMSMHSTINHRNMAATPDNPRPQHAYGGDNYSSPLNTNMNSPVYAPQGFPMAHQNDSRSFHTPSPAHSSRERVASPASFSQPRSQRSLRERVDSRPVSARTPTGNGNSPLQSGAGYS